MLTSSLLVKLSKITFGNNISINGATIVIIVEVNKMYFLKKYIILLSTPLLFSTFFSIFSYINILPII